MHSALPIICAPAPVVHSSSFGSLNSNSDADSNEAYNEDLDAPYPEDQVFAARTIYSAAIHAYTSRQWETTRLDIERASAASSSPVLVSSATISK
ncbi:hypothetical protein P7C70_g5953, partial [Phenoliferia sp. Uapishka_3]